MVTMHFMDSVVDSKSVLISIPASNRLEAIKNVCYSSRSDMCQTVMCYRDWSNCEVMPFYVNFPFFNVLPVIDVFECPLYMCY